MAFKIKAIIVIIFLFGMLNSCRQTRSFDNKNDRALKKYIIDNQYIINPQNGECYGYIDSILYCKNLPSEMLLVYTSKLTGELLDQIMSLFNRGGCIEPIIDFSWYIDKTWESLNPYPYFHKSKYPRRTIM